MRYCDHVLLFRIRDMGRDNNKPEIRSHEAERQISADFVRLCSPQNVIAVMITISLYCWNSSTEKVFYREGIYRNEDD